MPQNAFFLRTRDLLVSQKTTQRHFFSTLHPLSTVIFATATVLAFVLLRDYRFNFHCYTQREATPTQKSARKWRCDLSRLLARKITKGIHSCKPVSVNYPIGLTPLTIIPLSSELRSCVKVEVAVPNKPTVSVEVKQHFSNNNSPSCAGGHWSTQVAKLVWPRQPT